MSPNRQRSLLDWLEPYYPVIRDRTQLPAVPRLLAQRQQEFCLATDLTAAFVADVCYHGYLPMGESLSRWPLLLIKSHHQRCVLDFAHLHRSRKLKRHARGLTFAINQNFATCLRAIADYHSPTWLIDPLCAAFVSLHQQPLRGVALHSIEIYDGQRLVAGEVGYTTGAIYTSLAGFHRQNGAGSVQLGLLGQVLAQSGFAFWDLGMELPYKLHLGASCVDRTTFLARWASHRDARTPDWAMQTLDNAAAIALLKAPSTH